MVKVRNKTQDSEQQRFDADEVGLCVSGVPEVPKSVSVRERSKGGAMEVVWKPVLNTSAPVLYIVETRHSVGYHNDEARVTQWNQISQVGASLTLMHKCYVSFGTVTVFVVTVVKCFVKEGMQVLLQANF